MRRQPKLKPRPVRRSARSTKKLRLGLRRPVRIVTTGGYGPRRQWIMQDGTKIAIEDMDDSHLLASIDLLKRQMGSYVFLADLAEDACDVLNSIIYQPSIYYDLTDEAKRRKLSWTRKVIKVGAKKVQEGLTVDFSKATEVG